MAKLPVVTARECIRALERAGFRFTRQKGSHITMRRDDPPSRVVIPEHKGRTLRPGTLRRVIKDAGLSVDEFRELL